MKNNCITEQKLMNFNNKINEFIRKSKFLDQDGLRTNNTIVLKFINLQRILIIFHKKIGNRVHAC